MVEGVLKQKKKYDEQNSESDHWAWGVHEEVLPPSNSSSQERNTKGTA